MSYLKKLKLGQSQLVEATYVKVNKEHKNQIGFSHTRNMWSSIFATANPDDDLKTAENFDYYKINAAKLYDAYRQLRYGNYNWGNKNLNAPEQSPDKLRIDAVAQLLNLTAVPSDYQFLLKDILYGPFIKHQRLPREKVLKLLLTDMKLPKNEIEQFFGTIPEAGEDVPKIGGSPLYFPEGAKPANVVTLTKLVTNVYTELKDKGLAKLFNKPIHFVRSIGNRLGYYELKDKEIKIAYTAANNESTRFTVLHEYGHKYFHEFFGREKEVEAKWRELRIGGTDFGASDVAKEAKVKVDNLLAHLKVGDIMVSLTKKFKGDWTVVGVSNGTVKLEQRDPGSFDDTSPRKAARVISGPILYFMDNGWTSKNPKIAEILKYSSVTRKHEIVETDAWFPTKYSETSSHEWFAELFALYISGKLKGEPASYMQSLVKG